MHVVELERSLRQLHLRGMATVLETRLRQAQAEAIAPIDLIAGRLKHIVCGRISEADYGIEGPTTSRSV
jgi:hypothetical protein